MFSRILILILVIYVAITQNMINGYIKMNDRLQKVNENLLKVCSGSTINEKRITK